MELQLPGMKRWNFESNWYTFICITTSAIADSDVYEATNVHDDGDNDNIVSRAEHWEQGLAALLK
jgi:hypothetical protein